MIILGLAYASVVGAVGFMTVYPEKVLKAAGILKDSSSDDWTQDPWRVALRLEDTPENREYMSEQFGPLNSMKKLFAKEKQPVVQTAKLTEVVVIGER